MGRWEHLKAAFGYGEPVAAPVRQEPTLNAVTFGPGINLSQEDQIFYRSIGMTAFGRTNAGVIVSENTALNLPVVYACVNRIANPIARFPIKIMKPKDDGSTGSEEVLDHPMSQSLGMRPNDMMSSRTVRKTMQGHALLWGNGYGEIQRNGAGQAVGIWPLMPWATKPLAENGVMKYRTQINSRDIDIPPEDVLHIMDLSQDGYVGQSQIRRGAQALGLAFAAEEFGSKFFSNDAKSGGFLMHPNKLSDAATANIQATQTKGLEHAHKVRVLEEGMKWISTTIPPEDAQFLGTRAMQVAEIARLYDVPLIMLQETAGTTAWGSGIEQLMIGFVRQTIEPWVNAWEQELNWKLFTADERAQGYFIKFNMKALLRGDSAARGEYYNRLFQLGAFSPNRILELEDEEQIGPEGDEHFVPAAMQTLTNAVAAPPVTQTTATPGNPAGPGVDQRTQP